MLPGFEKLCEKYGINKVTPLLKGWSGDKKYILDNGYDTYILRISDKEKYDKKKEQFALLQKIERLGLYCSRAVEFGTAEDNTVYTLLSYLEGEDGEEAVAKMTDREAYNIGTEAGKVLFKLHSAEIPPQKLSWWERYLQKMPRKIAALQACEYKLPIHD